ncbi:MAG TPA: HEAT repeat domain-containing protein [Gemmatimonadales bacterium]|jgi:ATP/ADP translocase/HEAT repeat protein
MIPPGALARLLETALGIRAGEGRRTTLLFLHLLLASAVFFLGRTVRDTLFLSRYPLSALPWLFIIYAGVSAVVATVYGRFADRLPRQRMIVASCIVGIVTYLGAYAGIRAGFRLVYPAFYVWTEIVANLFIVQFWTLANDLYDSRSAKRLFGPIGSARLLASVVVGLATGAVVRAIGTPQLIVVLAGLMVGVAGVAVVISRETRSERTERSTTLPQRQSKPAPVLADPYVRVLAILLLVAFTALNIGDYQFKAIARASFQGDALASFFARFYAVSGTLAFVFQLLLTPRILARAGVGAGMAVMPGAFGFSSLALLASPTVLVASLLKFSDNGFQFTIQETTFQALYVPFSAATKARARAMLEALVKPLGLAFAGVALIAFGALFASDPRRFSFVTLPLIAVWAAMIPVVRRRYVRQLEATLSARGSLAFDEGFVLDAAGRKLLVGTLMSGMPRQILVAFEQLAGDRSPDVNRASLALASSPDPLVREAALKHLASCNDWRGDDAALAPIRSALADPAPRVRAAAVLALGALGGDAAPPDIAPMLTDPDLKVRGNALAALLKDGGVEGGIIGGAELGRLLESTVQSDQVVGARALRFLGHGGYRPLTRLLERPDPVVRRAALRAAEGIADPRLVPQLVALLGDPASRMQAGQALVACGELAAASLGALLEDPAIPRPVRLELPRLIRRIRTPSSYTMLIQHATAPDSHLRLRIYAALSHLRRDLALPPEPVAVITPLIRNEIADYKRNQAGWAAARPQFQSALLDEIFRQREEHARRRVMRILELRYDPAALALVRERLDDPARRANALEVLDTLLDAPVRALVLPFADAGEARVVIEPAPDPVSFMIAHCRHPNPYIALLALDALARRTLPEGAAQGERLLDSPEALVREGAIAAVAAGDPSHAPQLIAPRISDQDPFIRRDARHVIDQLEGKPAQETFMFSTLEKILFLKGAAIFDRVNGEDLAPLARIAEVQAYAPGEVIVHEGEQGQALYILVHGSANVEHGGRVIAKLGPGDVVGEMAVLDSEPRSATVRATSEAEALRIGSEEFYEILHEQIDIAEGVIRMLSRRIRQLDAEVAAGKPAV